MVLTTHLSLSADCSVVVRHAFSTCFVLGSVGACIKIHLWCEAVLANALHRMHAAMHSESGSGCIDVLVMCST